jgi:hypothetical protein
MTGSEKKNIVIQPRDRILLSELSVMRIIDRKLSMQVAGFHSVTRANERLLKLTRGGMLKRFFVGSVAAGRKAIYTLSPKGILFIDGSGRPLGRQHGSTLVGDLYVEHQMKINEIYIAVKHQPLPQPLVFVRWKSFYRELVNGFPIIPDGYFELATSSDVRAVFLEVDLGHQSKRVWEQKVRTYLALALSGEFPRLFGQRQFRIAVITTSPRRLQSIQQVIAKQTDKIFWLTDYQTLSSQSLWLPVWLRPTGETRQTFF